MNKVISTLSVAAFLIGATRDSMRTRYFKRILACGLPALLIVSILWMSWRELQQRKLNRSLIAAIERVDGKTTIDLLGHGADPNATDSSKSDISLWRLIWDRIRGVTNRKAAGTPALLLAINAPCESTKIGREDYQRSVQIVKALLDHGADVQRKDSDGFDALYDGLQCGYGNETLHLLIRHHAEVNLHYPPAGGRTPLMYAAGWGDPEEIDLLLDAGAKIDDQDEDGNTALMYAESRALPDNVAALLARHADPYIKDKTGNTPLTDAQASLASNVTTPNNHGEEHESWDHIVRLLKQATKQTKPRPHT